MLWTEKKIIDGSTIGVGDVLIGLPSTGLHTNGYTLARHILSRFYTGYDTPERLGGESVGDNLLRIHRSYLKTMQSLQAEKLVKGAIHVTGGGIPGNAKRVVPAGLVADVDYGAWERPVIFNMIKELGSVPEDDMRTTFNLGIGLIVVVSASDETKTMEHLRGLGEEPLVIGQVGLM